MTQSPPSDQRPNTHYSCRLAPGSAQARIGWLDWPAVAPQIVSRSARALRSPRYTHPPPDPNRSQRPPRSSFLKPHTAAKSP
jgi:hypothetical protein